MRPQIQRLLDQLIDTPAFVVGKYLDILAWNPLAAALLIDVDKMAPHERNYVRMMFTDPRMKDYYEDWETMARTGVALLACRPSKTRRPAARRPRRRAVGLPPAVPPLVGRTQRRPPGVRHQDHPPPRTRRPHPRLGRLPVGSDPDQQLIVWSAEPGSATHDKFRILSSWIAASPPAARDAPTSRP